MTSPGAPEWLDELDLHVGAPDASMGTRSLDLDRWFLVDDEWDAQRADAARVLEADRSEVLAGVDGPELAGAVAALDAAVGDWLADRDISREPPPPRTQRQEPTLDVLAATRLQVADDLCVLVPGPDGWVLAAGCVCFPSYWSPAGRIGLPLSAVHGPVPGYPGALAGRVEGFLGRLRPGQGVWRRNWLVHDVADLHLPHWDRSVVRPTPVPEGRWLRSERQALVRLPDVTAVAFTIRTQQVPVAVLAARPDVAGGLAAAIRGWSRAQRAYKGAAVDDELVVWLERVASGDVVARTD